MKENIIDVFELLEINPDVYVQELMEYDEISSVKHDREKGEIIVFSPQYGEAKIKYKILAKGSA